MEIFGRPIGRDHPPYFVAEIGANHDGVYERALRLIELAADAGADAVKFQHFEPETIVSRRGFEELGKKSHQAGWKKGVYETYEAAAIPLEWTEHIANYAREHGMAFVTTPYSLALVEEVAPHVDAYKIGSGDVSWPELILRVGEEGLPVLVATGASTQREVEDVVSHLDYFRSCLMQCNTDYRGGDETLLDHANLRVLESWGRDWPDLVLGLSDHGTSCSVVNAAIALGARVVERHFTDDCQRSGPDHSFAMTPLAWKMMVNSGVGTWRALGSGQKKVEKNEEEARIVQRRALRYARGWYAGRIVAPEDLVALRPCPPGGISPDRKGEVVGRKLKKDVVPDELVRWGDFE